MPFVTTGGARHFYRLEGNDDRPVLMLAHSIGCDHAMWQDQVGDLLPFFRVLRYDLRGHGASDATPGDYTLDLLAEDALALADALGIERFAFCGLSLGGMIGLRLAVLAPVRITRLVLANTSPYMGDPSPWEARRRTALEEGMDAIVPVALGRFFSPERLARRDPRVASVREVLRGTSPLGYAGCCAAIRDMDQREALGSITTPTLLVAGDRDVSTPWAGHGEVLAGGIRGARVVHLPASHLSNLDRPRGFNAALHEFLLPAPRGDPLAAGLETRRAVLGDAHVDRALARQSPFDTDFQALITRYAWGAVWTRPGLDARTRRLLVLVATASLGRWEEFRLHVRAGLAHELEPADLKEALLQVAVYAGVPAANTGFQVGAEEIDRAREEPGTPEPAPG